MVTSTHKPLLVVMMIVSLSTRVNTGLGWIWLEFAAGHIKNNMMVLRLNSDIVPTKVEWQKNTLLLDELELFGTYQLLYLDSSDMELAETDNHPTKQFLVLNV